jgi:hypothetical protein
VFLPAAFGAASLAWLVVEAIYRFASLYAGLDTTEVIPKFLFEAISSGAMGAAFVYVGAKVAPLHCQNIAFLLAAIGLLITSIAVYLAIRELNYLTLWAALWGTIGTATSVYGVSSGDILLGLSPGRLQRRRGRDSG